MSAAAEARPVVTGADETGAADPARLTVWLRGRVQGVGMRWWVRARALELGLVGSATNLADGRVEVVAQGERAVLKQFEQLLRSGTSPGSVTGVAIRWATVREGLMGFVER